MRILSVRSPPTAATPAFAWQALAWRSGLSQTLARGLGFLQASAFGPGLPRALALGLALGLLACAAPAPPPEPPQVEAARVMLRRARVEAAERAPAELARALAAAAELERRLARERAARPWARRPEEVERLAAAAEQAARAALARARAEGERLAREVAARREGLEAALAGLAGEMERAPADRPLRAGWGKARIEVEAAREAEARGDLAAAARSLDAADAALAGVDAHLGRRYARLGDPASRRLWQGWVDETVAATRDGGPAVVVDKLARRCYLLAAGRVAAVFPAELGRDGLADKLYAGDAATPEGRYRVVAKREGAATRYHRALVLDYPTADDRREFAAARRRGLVPAGRSIGGAIEIHGHGGRAINWTSGCVALRDRHMDRLYAALETGAPVTIVGTARLPAGPPDAQVPLAEPRPGRAGR